MAYSGTVSRTTFNAGRVVDHAFRRCRLPAQSITSEMQAYALDLLYLLLSNLSNPRILTWTIERLLLPMQRGNPAVELPIGTVGVLNVNYRTLAPVVPDSTATAVDFILLTYDTAATLTCVGAIYSAASTGVLVQTSDDAMSWTTVGTLPDGASGATVWLDIIPGVTTQYIRVYHPTAFNVSSFMAGNNPSEIPFGQLNQDDYVNQANKVFQGRPTTYWFQRDIPQPVLNIWPAPNAAAELDQVVVWRQRHIMDTANLRNEVEVPQRWLDAITWLLAYNVAMETPAVDINILPMLKAESEANKMIAYDGDSDGAPSYYQPYISPYTR